MAANLKIEPGEISKISGLLAANLTNDKIEIPVIDSATESSRHIEFTKQHGVQKDNE